MWAVLSAIPMSMAGPEMAFGILRVRKSVTTQTATKTTTVAAMRDDVNVNVASRYIYSRT